MNSPLSYLGGKSRLVKTIVPMIPPDHVCYCEAFCGAAWVLFGKEPSKGEVINDADSELATFWRVVQNHYEPFIEHFKWAIVSRQIFEWEKLKRPETLTDVQRAVRYYYLQKLGFGGRTHGRTFGTGTTRGPGLNLATIEESLVEVHWRLSMVIIEHLDACDCIRRYDRPTTFFYLDPPYWKTAGYAVPFGETDYHRIRECLAGLAGTFIMSLNDTEAVRDIFADFRIQSIKTTYSTGNGRTNPELRGKEAGEVLIHNLQKRRGKAAVSCRKPVERTSPRE